jgi:hypothetical protein
LADPMFALTSAECGRSELCQGDVIVFGEATDTDRPYDVVTNDKWDAAAPAGVAKVTEICDRKLFLSCGIADVTRGLALACRCVGLVDRVVDRRQRTPVSADQCDEFAVMVDHRYRRASSGPLQICLHH